MKRRSLSWVQPPLVVHRTHSELVSFSIAATILFPWHRKILCGTPGRRSTVCTCSLANEAKWHTLHRNEKWKNAKTWKHHKFRNFWLFPKSKVTKRPLDLGCTKTPATRAATTRTSSKTATWRLLFLPDRRQWQVFHRKGLALSKCSPPKRLQWRSI